MGTLDRRKLFLHVGTEKTGSTAIQHALRENEKQLKKEGIRDIGRPSGFRKIIETDCLDDDIINKSIKELSARIKREILFRRNTFIISEETFSGNITKGYTNSRIVAETLKRISEPLNVEVFIVIYLRRQDKFVESAYTQQIKEGDSLAFDDFVKRINQNWFNWEILTENYAKFFGKKNTIVKRYSKDALPTKDCIVQGFGEIVGSKTLKGHKMQTRSNPGYSRDALEIAKMLNSNLNPTEKEKLRYILQKISSKKRYDNYSYFYFKERLEFLSRYKLSNAAVVQKYFNDTQLFKKPVKSSNKNDYQGLKDETLVVHLFKMALQIESLLKSKNRTDRSNRLKNYLSAISSNFPLLKQKLKLILGKYH